jgi:hypothetical protein
MSLPGEMFAFASAPRTDFIEVERRAGGVSHGGGDDSRAGEEERSGEAPAGVEVIPMELKMGQGLGFSGFDAAAIPFKIGAEPGKRLAYDG